MLRNRFLILLGASFLAASAAWADGSGYVNCSNHPDDTPVFGKARQTREVVATLPCGQRFTVLLYGFIFSRIQTADGKIGYVYSNLIDQTAGSAARPAPAPSSSTAGNIHGTTITPGQPNPNRVAQPAPVPAVLQPASTPAPAAVQPAPTRVPEATASVPETTAKAVQPNPSANSQPQPEVVPAAPAEVSTATSKTRKTRRVAATTQPMLPGAAVVEAQLTPTAAAQTPAPTAAAAQTEASATKIPEAAAAPAQARPSPAPQTEVAPAQPAPTETPASIPNTADTSTPSQPSAAANTEADAAPAQPAVPAPPSESLRSSWEKPNPGGRHWPLIELFGGYSFARLNNGAGSWSNLNGGMGSFGYNVRPWLQLVADSSYNLVTVSNTKTVLYGNHWGPRVFLHRRNRFGLTPFVEGLFGGSRADITVSGTGGYSTSENVFSMKVGGGIDIKPSRRFEIRLLDVDYYRTAFGQVHQSNYWASAGIVLRLFGGSE